MVKTCCDWGTTSPLYIDYHDNECECAGTSRDMARRVLRQIRDENIIVSTGKGRNAKWKKRRIHRKA